LNVVITNRLLNATINMFTREQVRNPASSAANRMLFAIREHKARVYIVHRNSIFGSKRIVHPRSSRKTLRINQLRANRNFIRTGEPRGGGPARHDPAHKQDGGNDRVAKGWNLKTSLIGGLTREPFRNRHPGLFQ